jgi:glycosyltransferase involved in cell wall biosynthesis
MVQECPHGLEWEIVVVDNNSNDDTFEVTNDFMQISKVPLRYEKEEKQGLSHARNRGIIESKGRYIAFTDDDAIADSKWVAALYDALNKYKCDCVGGRIYLKPQKKLPCWLERDLWGFLGYLDYGDKVLNLDRDYSPFGGNMVFSREVFERTGFFNPDYGRKGKDNFGGEEYELFLRLLDDGVKGIYAPDAIIYHVIEEAKLRRAYFRNLHFREGMLKGRNYESAGGRGIKGIPFFIFPQIMRSVIRFLNKPTLRMQMNIWWFLGFMKGRIIKYKNGRGKH